MILARMGLPLRYKGVNVISLVVEASTDRIGALTGKLGRIDGCKVKSVLTEFHKESIDGGDCTGSEQE